jgi:hypothetical protein
MGVWNLRARDLKGYPHFDSIISAAEAEAYATNAKLVASHTFYPFIRYIQRWNRFAPEGATGRSKERPIRYAARRDAYIFSYYRHLLSEPYEAALKKYNLDSSVLAYRRLREPNQKTGKCNIHFARDAVLKIRELGNCCAIALDISGFFENLDHEQLKKLWCRMLGVPRLSNDHFKVFKAITQYSVVDKQLVYERLGHFGFKRISESGRTIDGYLTAYKDMPKQLCTGREFREKIAGGGKEKTIIEKNFVPYGIPQGAPISDLLANLYLLDFDQDVSGWARSLGGAYYRYSDDILILVPGNETEGRAMMDRVRKHIKNFGTRLAIKEEKAAIVAYKAAPPYQTMHFISGKQARNGLEYLGFRYDGRSVYLRNSTLSNLRRKVALAARRSAIREVRRYPDKDAAYLKNNFDYERLIERFGKVQDFIDKHDEYRSWTFWTYAKRAYEVLGPIGGPILRQLRRHRSLTRLRAEQEIDRAVSQRERRKKE